MSHVESRVPCLVSRVSCLCVVRVVRASSNNGTLGVPGSSKPGWITADCRSVHLFCISGSLAYAKCKNSTTLSVKIETMCEGPFLSAVPSPGDTDSEKCRLTDILNIFIIISPMIFGDFCILNRGSNIEAEKMGK